MSKNAFFPADIMLPVVDDMTKWSVVACDQYSSDRSYWESVKEYVGEAPSTLKLIVPEAYLGDGDTEKRAADISAEMKKYISDGTLKVYENSFIYLERTMSNGAVRRGLVGKLDLDRYDYRDGSETAIRASEGTIISRLPARVEVRRGADIELPHIMALISDKDKTVIEKVGMNKDALKKVYDFDLIEKGGHISGWLVEWENRDKLTESLNALADRSPVEIIMGDGNHSLAAAKTYWEEIKSGVPEKEREAHPARYALVEINNVYDDAITFEAIHRVVVGVDTGDFIQGFIDKLGKENGSFIVSFEAINGRADVKVSADSIGQLIGNVQDYIDAYLAEKGGTVDYIHGEREARSLSCYDECVSIVLPDMKKDDFFETVIAGGVFPRKSFSIGHANEKRYYLECRKIK